MTFFSAIKLCHGHLQQDRLYLNKLRLSKKWLVIVERYYSLGVGHSIVAKARKENYERNVM